MGHRRLVRARPPVQNRAGPGQRFTRARQGQRQQVIDVPLTGSGCNGSPRHGADSRFPASPPSNDIARPVTLPHETKIGVRSLSAGIKQPPGCSVPAARPWGARTRPTPRAIGRRSGHWQARMLAICGGHRDRTGRVAKRSATEDRRSGRVHRRRFRRLRRGRESRDRRRDRRRPGSTTCTPSGQLLVREEYLDRVLADPAASRTSPTRCGTSSRPGPAGDRGRGPAHPGLDAERRAALRARRARRDRPGSSAQGIATPNHVLTVAGGEAGPCPATEPQEVYDGIEPYPSVCHGRRRRRAY